MSDLQGAAKTPSAFFSDAVAKLDKTVLGGPENRTSGLGPIPINQDLMVMASRLAAEQARVAAGANPCCVAICSPDPGPGRFVEHSVAEIADRFSQCLRSYDSIHRFGRDRVVICLPHLKRADASAVLSRLKELVCALPFHLPDGRSDLITVSLGAVMLEASLPVHEAINRADRAMEQSRLSGRNRFLMWSADMY